MRKKQDAKGREFWATVEKTARNVEGWPEWKKNFAGSLNPKAPAPVKADAKKSR